MKNIMSIFFIFMLIVLSFGCSYTPTQLYEGSALSKKEVASINSHYFNIYQIDDKTFVLPEGSDAPKLFKYDTPYSMLAGEHTIYLRGRYNTKGGYDYVRTAGNWKLTFNFKAGHSYSITYKSGAGNTSSNTTYHNYGSETISKFKGILIPVLLDNNKFWSLSLSETMEVKEYLLEFLNDAGEWETIENTTSSQPVISQKSTEQSLKQGVEFKKLGLFEVVRIDIQAGSDGWLLFRDEIIGVFENIFKENDFSQYVFMEKLIYKKHQYLQPMTCDAFLKHNGLSKVLLVHVGLGFSVGVKKKLHMIMNWDIIDTSGEKRTIKTSCKSKFTVGFFSLNRNNPKYKPYWLELAADNAKQFLEKYKTTGMDIQSSGSDAPAEERIGIVGNRLAADESEVKKLADREALAGMPKNHEVSKMREDDKAKLIDQAKLAEIAKNDKDGNARLDAAEKLKDKSLAQAIFANIAKYDKDGAVRLAAVKNLTDQALLVNLAKYSKYSTVRQAAERKLSGQDIPAENAGNDEDAGVRKAEADELNGQSPAQDDYIEVRFFAKDKETGEPGEYLGSAILDNGKLNVNITDKRLEKVVWSKAMVRGGEVKAEVQPDGQTVMVGGIMTYAPGTPEHILAIKNMAPKLGYYADSNKARPISKDTTKDGLKDEQPASERSDSLFPSYSQELSGANEVRVKNPNEFSVKVGLRSGNQGKNFVVSANATSSVFVPDGSYEIYFVYSNDPKALYKGDSFTLSQNGVEIQIVQRVDGNFGIKRVK